MKDRVSGAIPSFLESACAALETGEYERARKLLDTRAGIGLNTSRADSYRALFYVQKFRAPKNFSSLDNAIKFALRARVSNPIDVLAIQILSYSYSTQYLGGDTRALVPAIDCLNSLKIYFLIQGNAAAATKIFQDITEVIHAS